MLIKLSIISPNPMNRHIGLLFSVLLVLSGLSTCDATLESQSSRDEALLNVQWNLDEIEQANETLTPAPSQAANPPYILFSGDAARASRDTLAISGYAGCNHFSGAAVIPARAQVQFMDLFSTLRACTAEAGGIEGPFLTGIENGRAYEVVDGKLTIESTTGTLRFTAVDE